MKQTNKALFCSKPFRWFEVTQLHDRGETYLCCPSWLDTPIGNVKHQPIVDIWNGDKAQEIRNSILDGSFRYCNESRCPYLQTQTGPVARVEDIKDEELNFLIKNKVTILPHGPKEINFTFDTSCNLSCPSCRTRVVVENEAKDEIELIHQKLESEAFHDAELIYLSGNGDPFGSPFHREWLLGAEKLLLPSLKNIKLHTNGLLWTPKMWDRIPEEIRDYIKIAEISIDAATEETYEINRRGGRFSVLQKNLKFISQLRSNGPLEDVTISMVVQANNYKEMKEFVRLGKRLGFDNAYFSKMVDWGTFSKDDYLNRAIHLDSHKEHGQFLRELQDEIFDEKIVDLGNLAEYRRHGKASIAKNAFAYLRELATIKIKISNS